MMNRNYLMIALLACAAASCRKSDNDELRGIYMETAPSSGRCYLNFISADQLVRTERGSPVADSFNYILTDTSIKFIPRWKHSYKVYPVYFRKLSGSAFETEYMYSTMGMARPPYMHFERQ